PEKSNIKRGKTFFNEFLDITYDDVDNYLSNLSESEDNIKVFNDLYNRVMNL
ncbi:MAG TPA: restriction endonuclease, partial [Ruminococcaceae bacterium]|nr:restriction endonuclease [Oscillospiraceae bacterium]